jgi:hypothetical protein
MQEWFVRTNKTKYPDLFTYTILEKNPDYVMGKPNSFREFSVAFELDSKENAYLISAAPDLYEILKEVVKVYVIKPNTGNTATKVFKALAKAEGKTK